MKNLIIITILIIASNLQINAQKEDYIYLFDTLKVWHTIHGVETGDFYTERLNIDYENNILNVNDTLYYYININEEQGGYCCYREDTATQRIYYRSSPDYPELLIYDFSMQEGDSMYTAAFSVPSLWLYTDSIRTKTFFGKKRKVYYLTNEEWEAHPIWIEGIGSLAGLPNAVSSPDLYWMGNGELTCCYDNDTLIYQSEYGEMYGCSFEYLDVGELAENQKVKIYPNPTTGIFTIKINSQFSDNNSQIIITDITGKTVMTKEYIPIQIDISNYTQGIYFVKIKTNNYSITKKIIKL